MQFNEFLYELRKETGMTQTEVADRLGVTNKAVSKWETGETFPDTSQLVPLADLFHITVDELLRGERKLSVSVASAVEKEIPLPWTAPQIAFLIGGISLILLGLLFVFWLPIYGACSYLLCVAIAVFCLIGVGFYHAMPISTNPKKFFRNGMLIALGCFMIIGVTSLWGIEEGYELFSENITLTIFFIVIALSVALFIFAGITMPKERRQKELTEEQNLCGRVCSVIMLLCTVVFFTFGFLWNLWHLAGYIYAVGGVLCGIAAVIIGIIEK